MKGRFWLKEKFIAGLALRVGIINQPNVVARTLLFACPDVIRGCPKQPPNFPGDCFAAKTTPALAGGARESAARNDIPLTLPK